MTGPLEKRPLHLRVANSTTPETTPAILPHQQGAAASHLAHNNHTSPRSKNLAYALARFDRQENKPIALTSQHEDAKTCRSPFQLWTCS
ncbi:hypothetical protein [Xylella fastidiosa]|uniref:Uncharacterized protein n=1 Tax=Xylella fastidiosa subsp. sandyi Ann-1 TaxID=155920 RepID=A0A060HDU9_XYLFS|nr:hypothetical protein [Xylella fastidiosa]AIC11581.1 hypothetical protein D934_11505 [Xylella fastidiosa subsp. sandyi Ann-1]UIX80826.1 hypothetical protein LZ756_10150 [Xylella fastidiosa subsp. sandyi]